MYTRLCSLWLFISAVACGAPVMPSEAEAAQPLHTQPNLAVTGNVEIP